LTFEPPRVTMNRFRLLLKAPTIGELESSLAPQKEALIAAFANTILAFIASENREPDTWESKYLGRGIAFLAVGWHQPAFQNLVFALDEPETRFTWKQPDEYKLSMDELRAALARIRSAPPRRVSNSERSAVSAWPLLPSQSRG